MTKGWANSPGNRLLRRHKIHCQRIPNLYESCEITGSKHRFYLNHVKTHAMKMIPGTILIMLLSATSIFAQEQTSSTSFTGMFSLGSRNTASVFNDDDAVGAGIGGQFRLQFSNRLNSEWFFDYITSKNSHYTYRNDYHIGWSLLFYPGKTIDFSKLFQPYFIAGHCFDYSKVTDQSNKNNSADRLSMATQAGLGTHINITDRFDCSLSSQYMIHFGKDIETSVDQEIVTIEKKPYTHAHGHLLCTVSFNYKLTQLWKK
jgi:hypothetical protein